MSNPPNLATTRIGFIGVGNMGGALVRGLRAAGVTSIVAVEPRHDVLDALGIQGVSDVETLCGRVDVLIVAVKPYLVAPTLDRIARAAVQPRLMISVAAGVPVSELEASGCRGVIRAMPNLAAVVGRSTTAIVASHHTPPEDLSLAQAVLGTVGHVSVLGRENDMHAFTALAGSGPAFVAVFIEALVDAAVTEGLPRETARASALAMVGGTTVLLESAGWTPAGLKEAVMSPGGVTAEGLDALEQRAFRGAAQGAIRAAARKSRAMQQDRG